MAAGDVINDVDSVAGGGGTVDYLPASGVEVVIKSVAGSNTGTDSWQISVDGANFATIARGVANATPIIYPVYLNSSCTFRRRNGDAGAQYMGYTGLQLK